MQYNFQEDNNLYEYQNGEKEFTFPTHVRQMGSIDGGIRIYMEDYVYTYLYQYAKSGNNREKLAVLVGKQLTIDGELVLVISGAIQGKDTTRQAGSETFTEESWEYITQQMDVYFQGLTLVGWMHTHPGFGAFLLSRDEIYHKERFSMPYQVLYVLDPIEGLDGFFVHNETGTGLRAAKGYFIYYEKNESMQEYMLENSVAKLRFPGEEEAMEEVIDSTAVNGKDARDRIDAAPRIRKILNEKAIEQKKMKARYSLLTGVSGILCVACLIMGAGLLYNQDRIHRLETEFVSVKSSYDSIVAQIDNSMLQAVFAQQQAAEIAAKQQEQEKKEDSQREAQALPEAIETVPVKKEEEKEETKAPEGAVSKEETEKPEQTAPKEEAEKSEQTAPKEEVKPAEETSPKEETEPQEETKTETAKEESGLPDYYIVEEGDNLGYISTKFYGTKNRVGDIMALNHLSDADTIYYGKKLYLPE